jgi:hypothetical protein
MADAVLLEHLANLDGLLRPVAGIGVDQQRDAVIHGLAHCRDDLLGAARPLILAAAAFGADAELEGIKAEPVAQPAQPRRLVLRA